MRKKLLIWDVDGTLITCKDSGRRAMDKAFDEMYGIKKALLHVDFAGKVDKSVMEDIVATYKLDTIDYDAYFELYGQFLVKELKKNHEAAVLKGVEDILEITDRSDEFYNVLGTGNCKIGAEFKLRHLGLSQYFIIGGFGCEYSKRYQLIEKAISEAIQQYKYDFQRQDIYVIGDTPADIACGKKVGVKTISLSTGRYTVETLSTFGPDYILRSLENSEQFMRIFR